MSLIFTVLIALCVVSATATVQNSMENNLKELEKGLVETMKKYDTTVVDSDTVAQELPKLNSIMEIIRDNLRQTFSTLGKAAQISLKVYSGSNTCIGDYMSDSIATKTCIKTRPGNGPVNGYDQSYFKITTGANKAIHTYYLDKDCKHAYPPFSTFEQNGIPPILTLGACIPTGTASDGPQSIRVTTKKLDASKGSLISFYKTKKACEAHKPSTEPIEVVYLSNSCMGHTSVTCNSAGKLIVSSWSAPDCQGNATQLGLSGGINPSAMCSFLNGVGMDGGVYTSGGYPYMSCSKKALSLRADSRESDADSRESDADSRESDADSRESDASSVTTWLEGILAPVYRAFF